MTSTKPLRFRADSFNLVNLIIDRWIILLVTFISAFVVSAAMTLVIKPLFRSVVVLYPTTNVVEIQTLFGIRNGATAVFGDETATEKVLQLLRSDDIKNYLVKKYDLMKHYSISESAKYKYTLLDLRMKKYIISRKTQYNSIEISVLDPDPSVACAIANDIAQQVDTVFNRMVREAGKKSFAAINNSYNDQMIRVKALEDSLRILTPQGADLSVPGSFKAGSSKSSWISLSKQFSPDYLRLINMFESENANLSEMRSRLTEAKMLSSQDLPYTYIINNATVSEKKALPKRSFIVLASSFSTLLLMIFILGLSGSVVRDEQ